MFRWRAALVVLGAGFAVFGACQTPTSITFVLRTDVDCSKTKPPRSPAHVVFGAPGAVEAPDSLEQPSSTKECDVVGPALAEIGTLVALPREDEAAQIAMVAVLGVDRPTAECGQRPDEAGDPWGGCIVARRRLGFIEGEALEVDVPLYFSCVGVPCDAFSTCVPELGCVDSEIDPNECIGEACGLGVGGGAPANVSSSAVSSGDATSASSNGSSTASTGGDGGQGGQGGASQGGGGAASDGGGGAGANGNGGSGPGASTGAGGEGGAGASGSGASGPGSSGAGGDGGAGASGSGASGPGSSGAGGDGGAGASGSGASGAGSPAGTGGAGSSPIGAECQSDPECETGACAQGICCETACETGCYACRDEYTGMPNGMCAPVQPGFDPNGSCGGACATCGSDPEACAAPECQCVDASFDCITCFEGGLFSSRTTCLDPFQCGGGITAPEPCPGDYRCIDSECPTTCTNDFECRDGYVCNVGSCQQL